MTITNRLAIILIAVCVLVAHAPTLFNGFAGDDNMLIVNNTAYRSWDNFSRLIFKDYIIDIDDILNGETKFLGSSDVSYRPVKSATHFIDYSLWQLNPFGYHLHNLIIHFATAVLLFIFLNAIFRNPATALFATILFAVHPIQSETVSSINYRHNLLIGLFSLAAMLSYMKSYNTKKVFYLCLSYLMYFLAIFSKEAAVIFPIIVIGYDVLIKNRSLKDVMKGFVGRYFGFLVVFGFFVYVYLNVFPNVVQHKVGHFGGSWTSHVVYIVHIVLYYMQCFIMPWTVKTLPPLYNVDVVSIWGIKTYLGIVFILATIWFYMVLFRTNRKICFLLFWFFAGYVVVSNIVPFVNPISYRFMYLPSIGLFAIMAFYIDKYLRLWLKNIQSDHLSVFVKIAIVILCVSWAWPLDAAWKNDHTQTLQMYRDFPGNARANMYAGMTYFHMKDYPQAEKLLLESIDLGLDDPRVYHYLATIYIRDTKKAEPLLIKCVKGFPRYATCHSGLGRIYLLDGLAPQAYNQLQAALSLRPTYPVYGYLIQMYIMQGSQAKAKALFTQAQVDLTDQKELDSLSRLFTENPSNLPIDIGF